MPQGSLSLDPAAQRDRMGRYVRTLLWQEERLQAIGWPLDVGWSESGIRASLTRGELVIRTDITRREWWLPPTKTRAREWAQRLTDVLVRSQEEFADADETGRRRVFARRSADWRIEWENPGDGARSEPVELVLEPGVFLREEIGGSRPLVHRLGDPAGISPQEAIERGWMRVGERRRQETTAEVTRQRLRHLSREGAL